MSFLLRVAGAYIVLVGAGIGVHFVFTPFYHSGGGPFTAWHVMNWFIAPAMLVTVGASYFLKYQTDGNSAVDFRRYLEVNSVFYGSVAASIIYFWNWFLSLTPGNAADEQFWSVLGAVIPILMVVAGLRLWQMVASPAVPPATVLVGVKSFRAGG